MKMTEEQMKLFCWIVSAGFTCGLTDILECLLNYDMHFLPLLPYDQQEDAYSKATDAYLAFLNASPSCPEDELNPWTEERLTKLIEGHYAKGNTPV